MKKYTIPTLEEFSFETHDMITVSGDQTSAIVSNDDKAGAQGIDYQSWNDSWN